MNNLKEPTLKIEQIYFEYCTEAIRIRKIYMDIILPYMFAALLLLIISIAAFWTGITSSSISYLGAKRSSYIFWLGLLAGIIVECIGWRQAKKKMDAAVRQSSQSMTGFVEFYRLHNQRRWWPKEMVSGKKYDRFTEIIQER